MAHIRTFQPLPGFQWEVEVHYCPTYSAAMRLFHTWYPTDKEGFCALTDVLTDVTNHKLCRMIFYRKEFKLSYVAHEAAHAGLHFARRAGLDLGEDESEELFAACVEKTIKGIIDNSPRGWHR